MKPRRNDSKGIAVPTVLIALLALSALAVSMAVSSRNDVVVAGLEKHSIESLQAADAALNYSLGIASNFADTVNQPLLDLRTEGLPLDATIKIDFMPPPRLPPPGIRVSARKMRSFHFLMTAHGMVKANATGQPDSATNLEMEVSKLGPAAN